MTNSKKLSGVLSRGGHEEAMSHKKKGEGELKEHPRAVNRGLSICNGPVTRLRLLEIFTLIFEDEQIIHRAYL